jgi:hypothetical protein
VEYKKVEILDNVVNLSFDSNVTKNEGQYFEVELFPTYLEYLAHSYKYESLKSIVDENVNHIFELELNRNQNDDIHEKSNGILAYGEVQSGKTMNMIAMLYKAIDLGYNMIFISTGNITKLHYQTLNRFKKDVDDFFSFLSNSNGDEYIDFPNREYILSRMNNGIVNPIRFRDVNELNYDDMYKVANEPYFNVFLVLKEQNNYENILTLSEKVTTKPNRKKILFIDDEADWGFEKVNGRDNSLYNKVTSIKNNFVAKNYLFKYVAFTATPYGIMDNINNQLITEDYNYLLKAKAYDSNLLEDEEFILNNQPFYCGMDVFHSKKGMKILDFNTEKLVTRASINDDLESEMNLIKDGMILFLVNSFYYRKNNSLSLKEQNKYTQGLFFNGIEVNSHIKVRNELTKWLDKLNGKFEQINYNDTFKPDFLEFFEIKSECVKDIIINRNLDMGNIPDKNKISFENKLLIKMISGWIKENCTNGYKSIVQFSGDEINNDYLDGVNPIEGFKMALVIGGNKISRGVTFDNLVVEIITAKSEKADTTLQRARWFGYREINLLKNMNIIMEDAVYKSFIESVECDKKYRESIKNEMK